MREFLGSCLQMKQIISLLLLLFAYLLLLGCFHQILIIVLYFGFGRLTNELHFPSIKEKRPHIITKELQSIGRSQVVKPTLYQCYWCGLSHFNYFSLRLVQRQAPSTPRLRDSQNISLLRPDPKRLSSFAVRIDVWVYSSSVLPLELPLGWAYP